MIKVFKFLPFCLLLATCNQNGSKLQNKQTSTAPSQLSIIPYSFFCPCGKIEEKTVPTPFSIQFVQESLPPNYADVWSYFVSQIKNYQRPSASILCPDLFLSQFSIPRNNDIFILDKHPWATNLYVLLFIPDTIKTDSISIVIDTMTYPYWNLVPHCVLFQKKTLIKGNALVLFFSETPLYSPLHLPQRDESNLTRIQSPLSTIAYVFQERKVIKKKPVKWIDIPPSLRKELYAFLATYLHFLNKPIYGELKVNYLIKLLESTEHHSLKRLVQLSTFIPP